LKSIRPNPILLEVFKHRFASIAEEMGMALQRTAFSPNIKERRDFSCALFDTDGEMVAQAAHIPVHLGSMPLSVKAAIEHQALREGDMVMLNDPFSGGTHLPDITLVAPVFVAGEGPVFYVANRAHHADVGGMSAGSMPLSTSIFQEGIIIPPLKIVERGTVNSQLMSLLLRNVRTPREREGDFAAQIMANRTGIARIGELVNKYNPETVSTYAENLLDYSERMARQAIGALPDGTFDFEDALEDDGQGNETIAIRATVRIAEGTLTVDLTGSDDQTPGCVNAVYAITLSCAMYVLRTLLPEEIPTNAGCFRPLSVITRPGSVVDARFPAAVAGGNVETSQRIVDTILGALARAVPEAVPAASQGTMNNLTIGGIHPATGDPFAYYETIAGGAGATSRADGDSAVQTHMTNTLNTPVEALEYSYPLTVTRYAVRRNSGGEGARRGGNGIVRELRLEADAEVTLLSERRLSAPYGLSGGKQGETGRNTIVRNGCTEQMPGKFHRRLNPGDIVRIETPGGGGHGEKTRGTKKREGQVP
jgi:N-methylhydantoinase B